MVPHKLSLRERLIGAGLLRPADPHERTTTHQKCSVYLQAMARTGVRNRSALDSPLTLAVLERWYTL
ncbi:MAG: hypothetical protein WA869_09680 [Alloacidobacterium sp.]|jgi:hypothetical protein